ncbi:MAG: sporulation membrane protein YtaF [Nitrospirae bacterium]|nr:sporulation membrane protein YtaF [Nitrospirota bacterium]
MHAVYTFFIALSNNFDNIGVRVAYSLRGIKISNMINLWISVITFFISAFAAYSGSMISGVFSKQLSSIIAMLLLSAIGLWMIIDHYRHKGKNEVEESNDDNEAGILHILAHPHKADKDKSKHIDFKEATVLGIALSINNVGGGLSAGMIGLSSFWVGLLSAVISFVALWGGNYISEYFIKWHIADKATVLAGVVLIAIGIEQLF